MKSEEALEILRSIVEKAGLMDIISIGCDKNESADIMWFSSDVKADYLAVYEEPLFPFSCIENITYKYKKENDNRSIDFKYADDLCVLTFYLKDNSLLLIECDEDGVLNLYFNDSRNNWTDNNEDFKTAISKYDIQREKKEVYDELIWALFSSIENRRLDIDLCKREHQIIFDYIKNNKNDNEILFFYAYEAAYYISGDYKDYPYLSDIIGEVKDRGLTDELLIYVKKRCQEWNYTDQDPEIYYSSLQFIIENITNHLNKEYTDQESD